MDLYMARQPIFDRGQRVFGYELLFRDGVKNMFPGIDGDHASVAVINQGFFSIDAAEAAGGKRAFIKFSRELLLAGIAFALPNSVFSIEILETVIDKKMVDVCRRLKTEGYMLVLGDCVDSEAAEEILPFIDVVKIDFMATTPTERLHIMKKHSRHATKVLAEKVETPAEFAEAKNIGCDYFQGYFFCKPVVMSGKTVSSSQRASLRLLAEVNRSELDPLKLRGIVETETGLTYQLLRYINSASLGVRYKVNSIDHAINMLGTKELARWVTLVTMRGMLSGKPEELVTTAAVRAKFAELMAPLTDQRLTGPEIFVAALFSLIDIMLGRPFAEILAGLPLDEKIVAALLGQDIRFTQTLDIIGAYERCDWRQVECLVASFGLQEKDVVTRYRDALAWANGMSS